VRPFFPELDLIDWSLAEFNDNNLRRLVPGDFGGTIFEGTAEFSGFSSKGVLVTVYLCLKPLKKDRNHYLLQ